MKDKLFNRKRRPTIGRIIFWGFTGVVAAIFFSAIFAIVVTYLWNRLMTDIFALPAITYLQAFGLVILARLLIGGWHKGHGIKEHDEQFHNFFSKKFNRQDNEGELGGKDFKEYWEKAGREAFKNYIKEKPGAGMNKE